MGDEFVLDYAIQFFPTWLAVVILIAVGFGLWKLARSFGRRSQTDPLPGRATPQHAAPCYSEWCSTQTSLGLVDGGHDTLGREVLSCRD